MTEREQKISIASTSLKTKPHDIRVTQHLYISIPICPPTSTFNTFGVRRCTASDATGKIKTGFVPHPPTPLAGTRSQRSRRTGSTPYVARRIDDWTVVLPATPQRDPCGRRARHTTQGQG